MVLGVVLAVAWHFRSTHGSDTAKIRNVYRALQDYTSRDDLPSDTLIDGQRQSWRVALYPYLINDHFAANYDYRQPYDAPVNQRAVESLSQYGHPFGASYYTNPGSVPMKNVPTTLLRITGPGTLGDGFRQPISDGLAESMVLIESPTSTLLWTSTRDFDVSAESDSAITKWLNDSRRIALFGDGSLRELSDQLKPADFRAMCTVAGGEPSRLGMTRVISFE